LLSPDEDFSPAGANSGIKYAESFKKYYEMLSKDPESKTYKRIFSEFNAALFGTAPTLSNDFIAEDGNYDSEVEKFKSDLRAESATPVGTPGASALPSPTAPPLQPDHLSISVRSHISHTITATASSQMSTVINSGPASLPEHEADQETPPPNPKSTQRPPSRKKGTKSSKSKTTTSNADPDTAEPPTRVLRGRK